MKNYSKKILTIGFTVIFCLITGFILLLIMLVLIKNLKKDNINIIPYSDLPPLGWNASEVDFSYDRLIYLTSHNAYATSEDGYITDSQQDVTVPDQIVKYSVRGLEYDTYLVGDTVKVCHTLCGSNTMLLLRPFGKEGAKLEKYLKYILDFFTLKTAKDIHNNPVITLNDAYNNLNNLNNLNNNWLYYLYRRPPIITLFLENYVKLFENSTKSLIDDIIETIGLDKFIFSPLDFIRYNNSFPTIIEMILLKKPLVIFSSNGPTQYAHNHWSYIEENKFDESINVDSSYVSPPLDTCNRLRRGDNSTINKFLLIHYHPSISTNKDYTIINNSTNFELYLNECQKLLSSFTNKTVNFIYIDKVNKGDIYEVAMKNK